MPMARKKIDRICQIVNWLKDEYPTPRRTYVKLFDLKSGKKNRPDGVTTRKGSRIFILIHNKLKLYEAVQALIEEWAHARTWSLAAHEHRELDHSPAWGVEYALLKTAYYDDDEKWEKISTYSQECPDVFE